MNATRKALDILLSRKSASQKEADLKKLAKTVSNIVRNRIECPECGHMGPHDDNGRVDDLTYCCRACGTHWDHCNP
jgi:ribosomal protein L37AE/L43A